MAAKYVKCTSPITGQGVQANTTFTITWESSENVNIYYRISPGSVWQTITTNKSGTTHDWTVVNQSAPDAAIRVQLVSSTIYSSVVEFSIYIGTIITPTYDNVLHGWGKPFFEIWKADGTWDYAFEVPYPMALIEKWTPETIVHKLYNGRKYFKCKGFWYSCVLDFSAWTKKETIMKFARLFSSERAYPDGSDKAVVIFYPRHYNVDVGGNTSYNYKVELDPESELELQQSQNHYGHRLFQVRLIGVERLSKIPIPPSQTLKTTEMTKDLPGGVESGYGTQYGEDYGG